MDDPTHLDFARVQVDEPFRQDIPTYIYFGQHYENFRDTHPRGHSLFLSLLLRADPSESEPPLHAAFLIFPLMAGFSMYFLGRRFGAPPLLAALLLLAAPVVIVTFHSLMTDPPGMTMWLVAVTAYIYGVDRRRAWLLALATAALLVGTFISYQVLSVIPLMAAYALLKRRLDWRTAIPFIVPALVFALSALETRIQYGGWPMFSYRAGLSLSPWELLEKGRGIIVLMGGTALMPVVAWAAFIRRKIDLAVGLGATLLTALVAAPYYLKGDLTVNQLVLGLLFAPVTALITYVLVRGLFQKSPDGGKQGGWFHRRLSHVRSDAIFLFLWFAGVLFYNWVILPYASPRYLLPLVPPVVILAARGLDRLARGSRPALMAIGSAAVLLTMALSVPVAVADYDRAATYRDIAPMIEQQYGGNGHTVWYDGDLGFGYYMKKEGFPVITPCDESPRPGDIIVWANLAHGWNLSPRLMQRLRLVDTITLYGRLPVVTLNYQDQSGMYGNRGVMVPYSFTNDFSEKFFILEVVN